MKKILLFSTFGFVAFFDASAQVMVKKQVVTPTAVAPVTITASKPKTMQIATNNSTATPVTATKRTTLDNHKNMNFPVAADTAKATMLDVFFVVATAFYNDWGSNKDGDTHWSWGLFDQNDKPVGSFHDDSNSDEYVAGTATNTLKMKIDNPAVFNDFINNGRVHINVAPNGNDTWNISSFSLTLDFLNPKFTKTISWPGFTLFQDKRDIDLYFYYDGKNFVTRSN